MGCWKCHSDMDDEGEVGGRILIGLFEIPPSLCCAGVLITRERFMEVSVIVLDECFWSGTENLVA